MTMSNTQVLIVGAGPTGLTLALWLTRLGAGVRIIDKRAAPGETSRALGVQARTLEFHRQIGVAEDVLKEGVRIEQLTVHTPKGVAAELPLGDFGKGLTPYPFAFCVPQDIHERVLISHLAKLGVEVERQTEMLAFEQDGQGVTAILSRGNATEVLRCTYLCGADGAHSPVRHALGIGFPGGTYDQSFYVADVTATGEVTPNGMDVFLASYGFGIVMPVRQSGTLRLIGVVPKEHEAKPEITFEMIRPEVERNIAVKVQEVRWFSTYNVHHRVADRFRDGRVFLAGDAGHIHSPAGGQGMNTGMGDAVNLAWKLVAVLDGRANERLLDTYEPERIAFARVLIKSTDQAFRIATSRSRLAGFYRQHIMPRMMKAMLTFQATSRLFFRTVSQTAIHYRMSDVSAGQAGKIRGGERLPYIEADGGTDNFQPLTSLDWQVHVYGDAEWRFADAIEAAGLTLHVFPFSDRAAEAGLKRNGVYLVRPDGHVAFAVETQDANAVKAFLDSWSIRTIAQQARSRKKMKERAAA